MPILQSAPPGFVFKIPLHRAFKPLFKGHRWTPAQFCCDARGINRIALIMSRAIRHKGNLIGVWRGFGAFIVQNRADHPDQINIRDFVFTANIIAAPQRALFQNGQQCIGVIFDV